MNKERILKMLRDTKLACENYGYKTDQLDAEIAKVIAEIEAACPDPDGIIG